MAKQPIYLREDADRNRIETYGSDVANGVEANPTDFPDPTPKPEDVRKAIKDYVDSIKPVREQSIATDDITEALRKAAVKAVNSLIAFAFFKVDGDDDKLQNANIELPKAPTRKELKKPEIKTSRMGTEKGSYFFRLVDRAGAGLIGVFRKDTDGEFRLVDAFDISYFTLKDQPSGEQTYLFKGKKGKDWGPASNEITVWIP